MAGGQAQEGSPDQSPQGHPPPHHFFTSAEAKAFIDVAESMGFAHQGSLGPLKGEAYRDNDRISVTDPLLAQAIWESGINRIFTDINVSGKVATGLNPNIRFYRYTEGQRFGRHIDESVDLGDGTKTYYTLLIYLSGKGSAKDSSGTALVGGETVFYDQRGGVVAECKDWLSSIYMVPNVCCMKPGL
ncbi:unnamed protein product [Urochloa decumbens]|uniref:Prolyl 4-hydroxylase alpha subunit domain-containing protein n=1 Tax=Urochloa decumbens TaxID=240449 RepID=A0ABC8Y5Y2_9POAL